jgi:glutamate racemase
MNTNPIGIFDSGIGGLTVAKAIQKFLPNESFIYFGDTAHLPYGDKSPDSIRAYSKRIAELLVEHNCKAIVIACNTASAHAYKTVVKSIPSHIPVINVVDPVAIYTAANYNKTKVGVIGTKGTIHSRIYVKRIEKLNPTLKVLSNATPLLASMIEEGYYNNKISQSIIDSYLSKSSFKGIEALILGCTHYPLIKKEVEKFYQQKIEIIDSASVVAHAVSDVLKKKDILNLSRRKPKYSFWVSDYTESFEKSTEIFFNQKLKLVEKRIWKDERY